MRAKPSRARRGENVRPCVCALAGSFFFEDAWPGLLDAASGAWGRFSLAQPKELGRGNLTWLLEADMVKSDEDQEVKRLVRDSLLVVRWYASGIGAAPNPLMGCVRSQFAAGPWLMTPGCCRQIRQH